MSKVHDIDHGKNVAAGWFKNITGLRFIAAAFVIVDHTEQARSVFDLNNFWKVPGIYALGDKAVTLFFVLSGFLITFLLLKEKKCNRKYFYKRFLCKTNITHMALVLLDSYLSTFCVSVIFFFSMAAMVGIPAL